MRSRSMLGGLGEGVRHGLVEAGRRQGAVDGIQHVLHLGARADAAAAAGQRRGDAVHAPQAQHFLVQVDLALQVGTEGGGRPRPARRRRRWLRPGKPKRSRMSAMKSAGIWAPIMERKRGMRKLQLRGGAARATRRSRRRPRGARCRRTPRPERAAAAGRPPRTVVVHTALVAHGAFADKAQVAAGAARCGRARRRRLPEARRVSSVTSVSRPPMTPAKATARSGVAMTVMSLVSARSSPSSVVRCSPSAAARTTMGARRRAGQLVRGRRRAAAGRTGTGCSS